MSRFIPKIFAENSTDNVVFGSWWEQGGNVGDGTVSNDPATLQGNAAWPLGLGAATNNFFKLMRSEELNGVLRVITTAILQQMVDGQTFWQSEMPVTQYQTIVQYQTGSDLPKLYVNITGTSTSTPPDSDTTNWYMFLDTGASSANVDLSNLTNGLANTICTTPATTTSTASSARPAVVIENYVNGTSWYRVWSDGWIEQGGRVQIAASAYKDITLLRPYSNADYMISFSHSSLGTSGQSESYAIQASGSYIRLGNGCGNAQYFTWTACGY